MKLQLRPDRRAGVLLGGVVLAVFVSIGATVALPATDNAVRSTKGARTVTARQEEGMRVFRSEGCWYCHTQYVRNTSSDAIYGAPLGPGAYAVQNPALLGVERLGPDLTHVASRGKDSAFSAGKHAPSYEYLSESDVRALIAYLQTLK